MPDGVTSPLKGLRESNVSPFANSSKALPIVDFWRNELTVTSSYGAAPVDLKEALELIKDHKIDVKSMITHKFSLDKIQEGFRIVTRAKENLKVVPSLIG